MAPSAITGATGNQEFFLHLRAAAEPVVVLGAGAIGSVYAAKLAARHAVAVVARPAHVDAIERDGLRLIGRETFTARVDALDRVDAIAPRTIVLLTTKVNATEAALAPLADLVRDDTVIVCVQNGLDGEAIARRQSAAAVWCCARSHSSARSSRRPAWSTSRRPATRYSRTARAAPPSRTLLTACGLDGRVSRRHQDGDLAEADLQLRHQPDHRRSPAARSAASPTRGSTR